MQVSEKKASEDGLSPSFNLPNYDRVRGVVRLIQKDDAVSALVKACNAVGEAFLFGGMVRDAIFGSSGLFGDLDIFVSGPLDIDFVEQLARTSRRTNFGGIRLVVGKFDVDIWELPKSYAFRVEKGRSISIPSLLSTVCFSTDAVAVSLVDSHVITNSAFRNTVRTRKLDFVSPPREVEVLQSVRIARLIIKNSVSPAIDVARYFLAGESRYGRAGLIAAEEKWRGRRLLDEFLVSKVSEMCELVIEGREPRSASLQFGSLF